MTNLNWYDLNEIWVCLHHELELHKENGWGDVKKTQRVLDKVNFLMKELDKDKDIVLGITKIQ